MRRSKIKHGARRLGSSSEYNSWCSMKTRCTNPNIPEYARYGARGISVCERWAHSFELFLADMGPKPSSAYTLDRYPDNSGNYEPRNCRWATRKEQNHNKRNNVVFEHKGERLTVQGWADRYGHAYHYVHRRLFSYGLTSDEAMAELEKPPRRLPKAMKRGVVDNQRNNHKNRRLTINGETRCLVEWSEHSGIPSHVIKDRLRLNWPAELAVYQPVGTLRRFAKAPANMKRPQLKEHLREVRGDAE